MKAPILIALAPTPKCPNLESAIRKVLKHALRTCGLVAIEVRDTPADVDLCLLDFIKRTGKPNGCKNAGLKDQTPTRTPSNAAKPLKSPRTSGER
jgi:hypothetical protein